MIRTVLRALGLALLIASVAHADEAAVTRRATDLRATAGDQGRSLAQLPANAAVTRTSERQGPWVQVRTAEGATGWLHMFDLGPATAAAPTGSGNVLRNVSSLFGPGRSTQSGSTAGIRGLDAEDIAKAQPNPAAVAQVEGWREDERDARAFAGRAPWQPTRVEPLPAPAAAAAGPAADPSRPSSP